MNAENRVVVTGMGAITPLGCTVDGFWDSIKSGACGIDKISRFDCSSYKTQVAAEVKDFDATQYIEKKEARRMDLFCQMGLAAAILAAEDTNFTAAGIDSERVGVIAGSGIGGMYTFENEAIKLHEKGHEKISPFFIPMMISNIMAGQIAIKFKAEGICTNIVTACASGSHCIGEAFRVIQRGDADVIFAGGSEASITPLSLGGFINMTALTSSNDVNRASIPFDKERSGFVMGEGAGILILENMQHAIKRGAKIYAEIVGYGATCDAYHITAPDPSAKGAAAAMRVAIKDAGISCEDIDYINAHGTGTPYNDLCETNAIKSVFEQHAYRLSVSSTKSMTGHLLGAAGAVEGIVCVRALQEDFVPPTINFQVADEQLDLDYTFNQGKNKPLKYALSNSFGFGGHNASIIFKKFLAN